MFSQTQMTYERGVGFVGNRKHFLCNMYTYKPFFPSYMLHIWFGSHIHVFVMLGISNMNYYPMAN